MARPDKTDLLNADVAHSMKAWAKATIDLDRQRQQERIRELQPSERDLNPAISRAEFP